MSRPVRRSAPPPPAVSRAAPEGEAVAALGRLEPFGDIRTLAAPITGMGGSPRITQLLVIEGEKVRRGQLLARFDNGPGQRAEAALLRTRIASLSRRLEIAGRDLSRYRRLAAAGAFSAAALDQREQAYLELRGALEEARAQLVRVGTDLVNTELVAPIDGTVLRIHARVGERPGEKGILELADSDRMEALLEVYESDVERVRIGQRARITSENGGFSGSLSGIVSRISPQVRQREVLSTDPTSDADARIVEVRVQLDPEDASRVRSLTGLKVIARLAVALAGIAFAGILMFMQLGFRDGLFDASVTIHKLFDADLVLISPRTTSSIGMAGFPRRRLVQTLADPAVRGITPVHWNLLLWRNPQSRSTRSILAIGFEPGDPLFTDPSLSARAKSLTQRGRVLFDERSRPEFGPIAEWLKQGKVVETEVAGKRVRVSGLVALGPSFGADGNMLLSRESFLTLMPQTAPGSIELGLVRLEAGADATAVADRLKRRLPSDVRILTKAGFEEFEKNYWRTSTAIGFIFTLGAAMGFVVGCVIVYQILHSDVSDHLPEYATLMAMGYRLSSLLGVVAREGLLLAVLGFVPAWLAGQGLYALVRSGTRLPVYMQTERSLLVFAMILTMCMASAGLAMRKLADADPAEIF